MSKRTILLILLAALVVAYFMWWRKPQLAAFYPTTPVELVNTPVTCGAQGQVTTYTSPAANPPAYVVFALPDTNCAASYIIRDPGGNPTNVPHTKRRVGYVVMPAPPAGGTLTVSANCSDAPVSVDDCTEGLRLWSISNTNVPYGRLPVAVTSSTFIPATVTCDQAPEELFYFSNTTRREEFSVSFHVHYTGNCEKIDITCLKQNNNGKNIIIVDDNGDYVDEERIRSVRTNDANKPNFKIIAKPGETLRIMGDCKGDALDASQPLNCNVQLMDIRIFREK